MDLQELKFKVDSTQVADAAVKLKELALALNSIKKPAQDTAKVVEEASTKADKLAKATKQAADSSKDTGDKMDAVTRQLVKHQTTLDILSGSTIEAADASLKLGDGFTKMQAGALATLKLAGATASDMQTLAGTFTQLNAIMGVNPFDKSASGLFKMNKEVQELNQVNTLLAQGLSLTKTEVQDLARDSVRLTTVFQQEGKSEQELIAALQKLKDSYVQVSSEKQKALLQAKQMEDQAKREAQAIIDAENAKKKAEQDALAAKMDIEAKRKMMFDAVIAFNQREADSFKAAKDQELKAMGDYYRQLEKLDQQAQKKTSTAPGKAAEQPMDAAVAQMYKAREKAAKDQAKAADYARQAEERLDNQLGSMSQSMGSTYADRSLKFKNALVAMGLSADEVAVKMQAFNSKLNQVADADRAKQLQYLSRAVSVQMGDVITSLASGMNPFLVMIQQGDQLRGVFQQVGADSNELSKSMRGAFGQIISSIVDTGKAVGKFIILSIGDAGKYINSLVAKITGLNAAAGVFTSVAAKMGVDIVAFGRVMQIATILAAGFTGTLLAVAAVLGGAYLVAMYKARAEAIELNKNLNLTGASLGLTRDAALDMAKSFDGVSRSSAITTLNEMAKAGGFTRDQIATIVPIADRMKKEFGIAIADTVKNFKDLQEKPSDNLTKLAIQLGTIPVEILKQVEALEKQKKYAEATQLAMQALADGQTQAMNTAEKYKDGWTRAAEAVTGMWNKAWNAIMGVAAPKTIDEQIQDQIKKVDMLQGKIKNYGKDAGIPKDVIDNLNKEIAASWATVKALEEKKKLQQDEANTRAQQSADAVKFAKEAKDREEAERKRKKDLEDAEKERDRVAKAYSDTLRGIDATTNSLKVKEDQLTAVQKSKFETIRKLVDDNVWGQLTQDQRLAIIAEFDYAESVEAEVKALEDAKKAAKDAIQLETDRINTKAKLEKMTNDVTVSEQKYRDNLAELDKDLQLGKISVEEYFEVLKKLNSIRFNTVAGEFAKITAEVEKGLNKATSNEKEDLRLQSSGMSARDIRIAKAQAENQVEMQQKLLDLKKKAEAEGTYKPEDLAREEEKIKGLYAQRDAWIAVREKQKDVLDQSDKMADSFTTFFDDVMKGTKSFKDAIDDLILSLANMIYQLTVIEPLKASLKAAFTDAGGLEGIISSIFGDGWGTGPESAAGSASFNTSILTNPVMANGGAWDRGIQKFANGGAFTNSVVSTPTLFKFAKGTGLMGEAGPEAIMPLTRGSDGKLGVQATGSSSNVEVVVNNYSNAQASTNETTDSKGNRRIEVTIGEMTGAEIGRSGSAAQKSIRNTFGVQPQLVRR